MENSADDQSIKIGPGFTMKDEPHPSSTYDRPSVEFRQGDSSEEAIHRFEKERRERTVTRRRIGKRSKDDSGR